WVEVEPMRGLDAKFLYSETPTAHMHTLKVAVFDTAAAPGGVSVDQVRALLGRRLDRLPPLRRRAVPVPLGLGHPVWVEDPDFDLDRHVSSRRVAPPGGDRELAAVVAEVAGRPLRRDRPLWEVVVVEGLAGDRMAVVAKVHHAVADGAASVALLLQALGAPPPAEGGPHPEALPGRAALLRSALAGHRARLGHLPGLAVRSVAGLREAARRRRRAPVRPPLPLQAPRTPFNVSLGAARTFAMTTVALDDLKEVRRAFDATVNDVFLAMCAGALRSVLLESGALPGRPLVASVPLSTGPDAGRRGGNHVDNLYVSIATDVADPVARLRHISAVATSAKEMRGALGTELLEDRAEVVPPQLYALTIRAWTRSRLAGHVRPPVNVVLSNVPGPAERLRVGPVTLEALYSVGPILEGIGVNVTAWSYAGRLFVSVLGSPESLPDPWPLADALPAALEELVRRARQRVAGRPVVAAP
ncbi:MAG: wax ester/triacylglycerol synthase family O-acyltransferase, partial [Acidobacteriota bacterium]|nr:wax ester/triacylglycerol synthase family O-acyltransferase [Acidobacteriota bacterium]